ncbi:unnamed protein product [Acanthoscelides obtectus]|uniref:Uncharacterized protein n=1 Tax=Acanthoscelides obtectus TaxID=200917 RepID=A0A9P0M6W2_ACAOB|nr:unnamed protein product [Acanthoscelides obtectus]CAK1669414.1 hypothetical protein AOBTE_LOCUS26994 [Acanthoscelides obtectus]
MMFTKKSEVRDMLHKIENLFWEIENVPSDEEKEEYMELIQNAKYLFHIRIFLFMIWLSSSLSTYSTYIMEDSDMQPSTSAKRGRYESKRQLTNEELLNILEGSSDESDEEMELEMSNSDDAGSDSDEGVVL